MSRMVATTMILAGLVCAAPVLGGQAGLLDPSFGPGGRVITRFGKVGSEIRALLVQPDGKIVAVGYEASTGTNDFALARYTAAGAPDPSFGVGGLVRTNFNGATDNAYAAALQPDGKIVVVGRVELDPSGPSTLFDFGFGLARYDTDGSLDATFGTGGRVASDFGLGDQEPYAVAVQADGKIVVAGQGNNDHPIGGDFLVARYTASGALDPSFGTGGFVVTTFPDLVTASGIVLQSGGRIVVGGGSNTQFTLARYESDGSLDPTFGSGGLASGGSLFNSYNLFGMTEQPDGKLVLANGIKIGRFDADGALDPTFGTGGVVTLSDVQATSVTPDADGRLLLGGETMGPDTEEPVLAVARLDDTGALDGTFGVGGVASADVVRETDRAYAVAVQADGRVVAGGAGLRYATAFAVARFLGGECGDGTTDPGEDCDDGNLTPGDGCDASCCAADGDGDGLCDANDPCTGPAIGVTKASIRVADVGGALSITGEAVFPHPFVPALDPPTTGFRLLVGKPSGLLADIGVGGGPFLNPPGIGWEVRVLPTGNKWTYTDKEAVGPSAITKAIVQDRSGRTPGLVKFTVKGKRGEYGGWPLSLPLSATFILDGHVAGPGHCAVATFPGPPPAPTCTYTVFNHRLVCK